MSTVDYRDRTSVMIWVILMGLALQRFLSLPARSIETEVFGSPITLTITANTILGAVLAALAASGTEAIVRAHPRALRIPAREQRLARATAMGPALSLPGDSVVMSDGPALAPGWHWVFWGLPVALVMVAVLLLPLAPTSVYWVLALIVTGTVLSLSMAGIYYTIDPFQPGYRRARLGLNALTYAIALLMFLVVYRTRVRSMVSATEVLLVSSLLALELLRGSERPMALVALYAGIIGLILGQATWALNYWRLDSLTGGLVLLVLFYDAVGIAQSAIQGRVRRRLLLEYGLITVAAFALIWEFAP